MLTQWRDFVSALGLRQIRRVVVFIVGMTVLLFGVALLVLPGPAVLVIPAGLAILGLEFRWARRWMRRAREVIKSGETKLFKRSNGGKAGTGTGGSTAQEKEPAPGSGVGGLKAAISDEGEKKESQTSEDQPTASFGRCQDNSECEKKREGEVHADCSQ
jgi:hypothetical protein